MNITRGTLLGEKCITDVSRIFLVLVVLMTSEGKLGDATRLLVDKGDMPPDGTHV